MRPKCWVSYKALRRASRNRASTRPTPAAPRGGIRESRHPVRAQCRRSSISSVSLSVALVAARARRQKPRSNVTSARLHSRIAWRSGRLGATSQRYCSDRPIHMVTGRSGFWRALSAKRGRRAQGRRRHLSHPWRLPCRTRTIHGTSPLPSITPGRRASVGVDALTPSGGLGWRRLTGGQISRRFGRAGLALSVMGTRRPAAAALRVWLWPGGRRSSHP